MILTDTHTHLYSKEYHSYTEKNIKESIASGVKYLFMPNLGMESWDDMIKIANQFPDNCFAMAGIHPCYVENESLDELNELKKRAKETKIVAIGEIGIDLHHDKTKLKEQELIFRLQIEWALELDLPIVIHAREAHAEVMRIIRDYPKLRGVFHCFSGSIEKAREIIKCGFYLGIGGVVTYKNNNMPAYLDQIPLEHIVLETDSPYLSPVPFRGKTNKPEYIHLVAQKLSEIYMLGKQDIAKITTANAGRLFGLELN